MNLKDWISLYRYIANLPNDEEELKDIIGQLANEKSRLEKKKAALEQALRRQSEHTNKNKNAKNSLNTLANKKPRH